MTVSAPELIALLRCPACMSNDDLAAHDDGLTCGHCGRNYRLKGGVPVMLAEDREVAVIPEDHVSNQVDSDVLDWIESLPGYSLNLGAGATVRSPQRCVELEYSAFRNTSLVADAHRLPFKDDVFDAVISYNTFEHLADPPVAAAEILRVLKPGGELRLQTAFLQPLHEPPAHFYNATEFGLRQWFDDYEIHDCFVPGNMYPPYALGWISSVLLHYCRGELGEQEVAEVDRSTLGYWRDSWSKRFSPATGARGLVQNLGAQAQQAIGFGFELRAHRPGEMAEAGPIGGVVPEPPAMSWTRFPRASREPEPRMPIDELAALLRCPRCRSQATLEVDGDAVACPKCGAAFPPVAGAVALMPADRDVEIMPQHHMSNPVPLELLDWLDSLEGYSLNLGAGSTVRRPERCVELEYSAFRNTTVLGDAHILPFKDATFDAVVSFNTFEHLADPQSAAREVLRVLKPGGRILIQTAFMQPLHEEPYHFYNATEFGMRRWFSDFAIDDCSVPSDMTIPHMLGWLSDHILYRVEKELGEGVRKVVAKTRLSDWARFWECPNGRDGFLKILFNFMPAESHTHFSAGFELRATKPVPSASPNMAKEVERT